MLAVLHLGVLSLLRSYAAAAELLTADGAWLAGEVTAADGLVRFVTVDGRALDPLPLERLIALRWRSGETQERGPHTLLLAGGDRLAGDCLGIGDSVVRWRHPFFGERIIPIRTISMLLLADLSVPTEGPAELIMANGDRVAGETLGLDERTLMLRRGERVLRLPRTRVAAIRFAAPTTSLGETRQIVRLRGGERLSGTLLTLDGRTATLRGDTDGLWAVPVAGIGEIGSESAELRPLSEMEPSQVLETPMFDERFQFRRNVNLAGGPLSIAGRAFEQGLACHARTELVWRLDGRFERLVTEFGVDDSAGHAGRALFRIRLDGREVFASQVVQAGQGPLVQAIDLRGVSKLGLVVDFTPDGSGVGAHGDWARPMLLRAEK